ncbi:MAG: PadR family transcriptional regulator [Anaerolinea sp.]|nr:PadR family transcriptional regulator [Anaerolinea sp.]
MNAQERLPLTETTLFILLGLSPGPKHGYAIMKEVEALSDGRITLSTGTLYGALKRLLDGGWIERVDDTAPGDNGRERKAYRLTELGQRIVSAEIARLQRVVATAQQRQVGV